MCFYSAIYNLDITVKHIYEIDNSYADILLRWDIYEANNVNSHMLCPDFNIQSTFATAMVAKV